MPEKIFAPCQWRDASREHSFWRFSHKKLKHQRATNLGTNDAQSERLCERRGSLTHAIGNRNDIPETLVGDNLWACYVVRSDFVTHLKQHRGFEHVAGSRGIE